jgi:hypothetical protein
LLDGQSSAYYATASGLTSTTTTANAALPKTGGTMTGTITSRDILVGANYQLSRSNHHSGHLEGSYNNVGANSFKSNPIYTIGSAYNPADATLSSMYGIGYSHPNASFISMTGASGWGMYVAAGGVAKVWLDGSAGVISSTGQHYVGSNVVWNAGNDGSGSGLDADTVDGIQGASLLRSDTADTCSGQINFTAGMKLDGHEIFNGGDTWFRSLAATGWYSASYGGGIHMQDTTWVRIYNSKALYVANQIAASGNITAYYSDERLKTKTGKIENALEKVQSLSGFTYVENELARSLGYVNENEQVALSAQDVKKVMPQAVSLAPCDMKTDELTGVITSKSGEDYLTIDYARLVPLLVEAIKEQQETIEKLTSRINDLETGE